MVCEFMIPEVSSVFRSMKLISLIIALCLAPMGAHAAVYQKVPGTAVYISVPDSFTLTTDFSGFIDNKTGAAIVVATMPPASDSMKQIFSDESKFKPAMAAQHYDIVSQSDKKSRDGYALKIYQGKQTAANGIFDKWSSMLFAPNASYIITVQAPEKAKFSNNDAMAIFGKLCFPR